MKAFEIPRPVKIAIVIILIIAFLVIGAKVIREFRKPANAKYLEGGGSVASDFSPEQYAKMMFDAIDGVFTTANTKNNVAQELTELNDNELIAVYNYWNDKYSTKTSWGEKFGTLPNAMSKEQNVPAISIGGSNYWLDLVNRFKRLKLP